METESSVNSRKNFYFVTFATNLLSIGTGNTYTWTSPTLPKLLSPDSPFPIDHNVSSWIGSLYMLGAALGALSAHLIVANIGFKRSFILCGLTMVTSWLCLAALWSVYFLYCGRLIAGFTIGMIFLLFPIYIAETSEDHLRGAICSLLYTIRATGVLMELCIGPYVSYHTLIIINAVSPVLFLICSAWVPESPYFLLNNNKKDEAVKTMVWLRGGITTKSAETIVTDIQAFIDRSKTDKKSIKDLVATPATIKGLLMTIVLLALQQLSGMPVMLIYTQQLFEETGTNISASLSAILFGIVYVLGATAGPVFSKQCGFRMPLIVSCFFLFLCEFILGVYLYFDANGYEVSQFKYTVMVCVLGYAAIYNFALGPMPWAIMGEVLPPNVKGQASTIATFCCFLSAFFAVKMFPILSDILPNYVIFWMFASVNIIASVFTLLFVPNTKGMSLQQIQDKLASKKPTKGLEQT